MVLANAASADDQSRCMQPCCQRRGRVWIGRQGRTHLCRPWTRLRQLSGRRAGLRRPCANVWRGGPASWKMRGRERRRGQRAEGGGGDEGEGEGARANTVCALPVAARLERERRARAVEVMMRGGCARAHAEWQSKRRWRCASSTAHNVTAEGSRILLPSQVGGLDGRPLRAVSDLNCWSVGDLRLAPPGPMIHSLSHCESLPESDDV